MRRLPSFVCEPADRQAEVFTRRQLFVLACLGAGIPACTPPSWPAAGHTTPDDEYIALGPRATIRATFTSTEPATAFFVTGVGAGATLLLPRSNIVRVLLPPAGITITAQAPCFKDSVHFVQAGNLSDGAEVAFAFSNLDRRAACDETSDVGSYLAMDSAPTSANLAWVIANSRYGHDWAPLRMVDTDRDRMTATLKRSGYRVMVSSNSSLAQLSADAAAFRSQLAGSPPPIAIVYMSGHGVALNGVNYLVPSDAPASAAIREQDLFAIEGVLRDLQTVPAAGGFAVVLIDACRAISGTRARPLIAETPQGVLVNDSAAPGGRSFDDEHGMSAWTASFIGIANAFPYAGIDQILGYSNRYTKWQSEASQRVQAPVLYGVLPANCPSFGVQRSPSVQGVLPRILVRGS